MIYALCKGEPVFIVFLSHICILLGGDFVIRCAVDAQFFLCHGCQKGEKSYSNFAINVKGGVC